jgi:hypothetical protein
MINYAKASLTLKVEKVPGKTDRALEAERVSTRTLWPSIMHHSMSEYAELKRRMTPNRYADTEDEMSQAPISSFNVIQTMKETHDIMGLEKDTTDCTSRFMPLLRRSVKSRKSKSSNRL